MIEINLLPKEMRRPSGLGLPKSVLIGAGVMVAVIALLAVITGYQMYRLNGIDRQITDVRRQADQMREDIMLVDRLVDVKTKVLARLAAIEKLDRDRERWVMVLDELSGRVPEFLWLTAFRPAAPEAAKHPTGLNSSGAAAPVDSAASAKTLLAIEGYSFTLNGLANFLMELNSSDYFDELKLNYAKLIKLDEQRAYNFSLRCRLEDPIALYEARDVENTEQDELNQSNAIPEETGLLGDDQGF